MARLTRTQKYAELRGKINQDRELSVSTNDLEKFADKLRNIEETAVQNIENEVKTIVEKEKKIKKEVPSFSVPSFQDLNIIQIYNIEIWRIKIHYQIERRLQRKVGE